MAKQKVYPNHTLEDALRKRGIYVKCLWEMNGPKHTDIAWMVGYLVGDSNNVETTIEDFIGRYMIQRSCTAAAASADDGPPRTP